VSCMSMCSWCSIQNLLLPFLSSSVSPSIYVKQLYSCEQSSMSSLRELCFISHCIWHKACTFVNCID
jgi:hypothetical protein